MVTFHWWTPDLCFLPKIKVNEQKAPKEACWYQFWRQYRWSNHTSAKQQIPGEFSRGIQINLSTKNLNRVPSSKTTARITRVFVHIRMPTPSADSTRQKITTLHVTAPWLLGFNKLERIPGGGAMAGISIDPGSSVVHDFLTIIILVNLLKARVVRGKDCSLSKKI